MSPTSYRTAPPRDANDSNYDERRFCPCLAESKRMAPGEFADAPRFACSAFRRSICTVISKGRCGLRPSSSWPQSMACRCATARDRRSPAADVDPSGSVSLCGPSASFFFSSPRSAGRCSDPDDYARLAREFVEDALAQGVIYGELFVSPPVWTFFNPMLDVRETMEAIVGELRAARPRATL